MRKYILILVACALAATSCNLDDQFSATNVTDLVTVYSNTMLINDYNTSYTITTDETDHLWQKGDRLMILFDIHNRDYEITLKDYAKCVICVPENISGEEPVLGTDPVLIDACTISGGYVNCEITYYFKKGSNAAHLIDMVYMDDGTNLHLYISHNGNEENPSKMNKNDLDTVTVPYSFQIAGLVPSGESRRLSLTMNILNENNEVGAKTYSLLSEPVRF